MSGGYALAHNRPWLASRTTWKDHQAAFTLASFQATLWLTSLAPYLALWLVDGVFIDAPFKYGRRQSLRCTTLTRGTSKFFHHLVCVHLNKVRF